MRMNIMVGYDIPTPCDPVEIGKRAYRLRCVRGMSVSDVAIQLSGILARNRRRFV